MPAVRWGRDAVVMTTTTATMAMMMMIAEMVRAVIGPQPAKAQAGWQCSLLGQRLGAGRGQLGGGEWANTPPLPFLSSGAR